MKIIEVQGHRNGVGGIGFYAVHFQDKISAKNMSGATKDFVAVLFPNKTGDDFEINGACAVLNIGLLPKVTFAVNSWRGDHFEPDLRRAIRDYEEEQGKKWKTE